MRSNGFIERAVIYKRRTAINTVAVKQQRSGIKASRNFYGTRSNYRIRCLRCVEGTYDFYDACSNYGIRCLSLNQLTANICDSSATSNYGICSLRCAEGTYDFYGTCSNYGIRRLSSAERTYDFYGARSDYGVCRLRRRQRSRHRPAGGGLIDYTTTRKRDL